jgi:trans-AT polyketide synthase/acyltransferase/oxidoreductase domain-containing protein
MIAPEALGDRSFLRDHGVRLAYVAGAMVKGIASPEMVIRMGRARLLSFYGSGGQRREALDRAIARIRGELSNGEPFGVNFLHNIQLPEAEQRTVEILFRHEVRNVEAAAFIDMTPWLVWYRLHGARRTPAGAIEISNHVLGKASRIEVAERFLLPPPADIVDRLRREQRLTAEEASLAPFIPMCDDLCAEADSAGHTDRRVGSILVPEFRRCRDRLTSRHTLARSVRIGAAGGLGTPEAIAAAFTLGADFVLTGSINQCTVEAGISDAVKDLLAAAGTQDMEIAPAGDMFEIGAKIQVLKRGVLFPARANKLYEVYRRYNSIDEIDPPTRRLIEERYFGRSFDDVWRETCSHYAPLAQTEIDKAEQNPKLKMAMIFRWYYVHTNRLAMAGDPSEKIQYQVHCGPAMGAFNQWVKGSPLEDWHNRHVDEIAQKLMESAAAVFDDRFRELQRGANS